ncbi:GNAT family N-acetyltransferase [Desulfovibrio aminophilus]|uniref:GNAT family N-acetyltransferase n=1 Tax=Desulfovibrio aminophilus TaxID=81425 RepID=UPI0004128FAC|nr:GNAT family N-acetyltransferase [Desulfovibrio aminophilus]
MDRKELIRTLEESRREIEPGQDVGIEPFRPEDALGVALAYHEAYGDAFPLEYVYDPAEIARRNASGDLHTVVARTPKGEVVGLFGLFRPAPNPEVYEAGQLIVLKSYRKRNVATALSVEALDNLPVRLGLPVMICEALTNNVASQHLSEVKGMTFTGLEVECMPSLASAKADGPARNISLLLMFKVFDKSACAVHLPEAYRSFCQAAYAEMNLPRTILPGASPAGDTVVASRFVLPEIGLVRQTVQRCGKDLGELVIASEAAAGERGLVQVFLNLGDAAAPQAVEALRDRGYFFSGLLPYWFGADGLAMQKVGREPDWEAIQVCGPKADAVRVMVREDFKRAWKGRRS